MKWFGSCIFVLVAGWMVGCAGKTLARTPPPAPPPSTEPVGSMREDLPAPDPAFIRERREEGPQLGLKLRFSRPKKIYRGWPFLMDVAISHPDGWLAAQEGRTPVPLKLIAASGGWDSLVKVRFAGPEREEVRLPWVQTSHPEGALVLNGEAPSYTLCWYLSPDGTREMKPGAYAAFAQLESSSGAQQGGWTGRVESMAVFFEVMDEPAPLPPEQVEAKALAFAQYEVYRGNTGAALATLDAHLAAQPDSPGALSYKAQLLESLGELEKAYALYGEALQALHRKYPGPQQEAPFGLMERRRALRERLYPSPTP